MCEECVKTNDTDLTILSEKILQEAADNLDQELMRDLGKMFKEAKNEEEQAQICWAIKWIRVMCVVNTDAYKETCYTKVTEDNFPMFYGRDAEFSNDEKFQTVARGKLRGYVPDAIYGFRCDPHDKYGEIKDYMYARVRK